MEREFREKDVGQGQAVLPALTVDPRLLAERQVDMAFDSTAPAFANLVLFSVLAWVLIQDVAPMALLLAMLAMACGSVPRIGMGILAAKWHIRWPRGTEARLALLTGSVTLQGLGWAGLCMLSTIYPVAPDVKLAVSLGLCGMMAGAIFSLTSAPIAFNAFILSVALGPVLALFQQKEDADSVMLTMETVWVVVVLVWGRQGAKRTERNLRLQIENEMLQRLLGEARRDIAMADALKRDSFAALAHELRTPLNAISGFAQSLEAEIWGPLGNTRYKEYAQTITTSAQHLFVLIQEILDLAHHDAGRLSLNESPVDLMKTAKTCHQMLAASASASSIQFAVDGHDGPIWIMGDSTKLLQVAINLTVNALRHTPPGGMVRIHAERLTDKSSRLTVADTGIGITEDDLARVLDPFVQPGARPADQQGGTGLGLPLAKRIAELHGGSLAISSAPGSGTIVSVNLPAARAISQKPEPLVSP